MRRTKRLAKKYSMGIAAISALLAAASVASAQTAPAGSPPGRPATRPAPVNTAIMFHEGGAMLPAYPVMVRDETPSQHDARLKWFREARFGLFIHWGVYAVPAGTWNGKRTGAEWIMNDSKISQADYRPLAKQFTAAKYDPAAWAALAKEAGVKYVVLTAKHHDGFTLYDSAYSDWNAVKASGAGRDLIQPLADAVRANGIKFGLYYSQSQDWNNPGGGTGRTEPWDDAQKKSSFDEYLKNIALPQIHEILDKYHPAYLFFDTEYSMTPERAKPIFDLTCQYPDLVINNRLGGGVLGDSATPEQHIATDPLGRQFEVCMTINGSWGYNANDTRWKSSQELIHNLSDISSKGGNYLLNVGPTAEGIIPEPEVERLKAIGHWLSINGEAVYGTVAGPFSMSHPPAWGRATMKSKPTGETTLYLHIWNWPADGKVVLPGVTQTPVSGRLLAGGAAVTFAPSADGLVVTVPGSAPDADASVVALEFSEPVMIAPVASHGMEAGSSGTPVNPNGK
jgi:alpha-L-fucosidase